MEHEYGLIAFWVIGIAKIVCFILLLISAGYLFLSAKELGKKDDNN